MEITHKEALVGLAASTKLVTMAIVEESQDITCDRVSDQQS